MGKFISVAFVPTVEVHEQLENFREQGVLTNYKNHPVRNFRHKHQTIISNVVGERIATKSIRIIYRD